MLARSIQNTKAQRTCGNSVYSGTDYIFPVLLSFIIPTTGSEKDDWDQLDIKFSACLNTF
jgi:hypothetical protein